MAGLVHGWHQPETWGERLAVPLVSAALITIPFFKPILAPLHGNLLSSRCIGDVCLQSLPSTCGPASAASLLRHFGQDASESQLAHEAFTYRGGTEVWYLARALRRRGIDTRIVIQDPVARELPAPAIAGVRMPGGAGHFVVVLEQTPTRVTVVDPLRGKLILDNAGLRQQYASTGFFLACSRR